MKKKSRSPANGDTPPAVPYKEAESYRRAFLTTCLSLPLSAEGTATVQVRDATGTLLGTLEVYRDALSFRLPNQKKPPERRLTWAVLARLMELGL